MLSARELVLMATPCRFISRSSVPTMSCASCERGNTHWSSCTVSGTPSASNQRIVSRWSNVWNRRFISLAPRWYTVSRLRTSWKELVRLQRPPPVIATFASGRLRLSYTQMSA